MSDEGIAHCDTCKDWGNTVTEEHAILYGCVRCPKCDRATYPNQGVNIPAGCEWFYNNNPRGLLQAQDIPKVTSMDATSGTGVHPLTSSSQENNPMSKKKYSITGLAAHNIVRSSYAVMGKGKTLNRKARKRIMKNVLKEREARQKAIKDPLIREIDRAIESVKVGGGEASTG